MLKESEKQYIFHQAFCEIGQRYPHIIPLKEARTLGVYLQTNSPLLIPVINGRAAYQLESQFTALIKRGGKRIRFIPRLDLSQGNDAFTLGYIAAHGWLSVRVKECNQPWFEEMYFSHTAEQPPQPKRGNYYVVVPHGVKGRWDNYYTIFDFPQDRSRISFGGQQVKWNDWVGGAKIHNKAYLLNLLRMGFRLGYNINNIETIRDCVSDVNAFDNGVDYQPLSIAA